MLHEVSAGRPARRTPALVMLLLLTAGLFAMHTLGHFTVPAGHQDIHGAQAVPRAEEPPHQPSMPMGSVVACMAILCSLIVFAVAAMLARLARAYGLALRPELREP